MKCMLGIVLTFSHTIYVYNHILGSVLSSDTLFFRFSDRSVLYAAADKTCAGLKSIFKNCEKGAVIRDRIVCKQERLGGNLLYGEYTFIMGTI